MTERDDLHTPVLLPHLLVKGLESHDDRPCFFLGETTASYKEVRERTSQFIQALRSLGVGKGSPTAVLSANRPEVLYNMAATSIAACRNTALHPLGSLEDHAYVLQDAGVETLVFDAEYFGDHVRALADLVPTLKNLLAIGGDGSLGQDYAALADRFEPEPLVVPELDPKEVCTVIYTGGTTGRPKGVMGTFESAITMTQIQMAEWEWPEEIRFLMATPLSHAAGAFFAPVLLRGGALYCMSGFSDAEFFGMIEQHRITATMLVPVMIYMLLDSPMARSADLSSLETIFYGASPMSPTRLAEGIRTWGPKFFQFYGQTEVPMTISVLRKDEHDPDDLARLASAGRPVPWVHLGLLDDDNRQVAPGEAGEICVRSPLAMAGYHGLPEQTAEATAGGWLHTGDVGRIDDEGFLHIVDRKKDMIDTGGFNVFPREVEDVIATDDSVAQVAVVGVPDERWGEAVKAVVVPRPGREVDPDALIALVKEHKGSVQAPKSIDVVDAIPMSPLGKADKKALRARYWEGRDRSVG
jgi:fatty-acyl-CoA synthase